MSTSTESKQLMTSLTEIKSFNPCLGGWRDILKGQNKTEADDTLFPLVDCLESNSTRDVCWLIGKRKVEIQICVKFARMCADSIKYIKNNRDAADAYAAAADAYAAAAAAADAAAYAAADAAAAAAAAYAADAYADAAAAAAAAAYAADAYADAAAYAAYAAYADAAAYAADAAYAAAADAYADAAYAYADAAYAAAAAKQIQLNKSFLTQCINEFTQIKGIQE